MSTPRIAAPLEKACVLLLVSVFVLPLALAGWLRLSHPVSPGTAWLRNATLAGMQNTPEPVPLSPAAVLSGKYQLARARDFNFHFPGRELLLRSFNEMNLRLFHAAPAGLLVGGPQLSVVETPYAEEYCLWRGERGELRAVVSDLRRMQDFCDARGIAFALVITPSKAAIYPEDLPAAWLRRYRPLPRYYDHFVSLLGETGIRYVDGHLIAARLKADGHGLRVFPIGGIHWGDPAAFAAANALLETLARHGLGVSPITDCRQGISHEPRGQDVDMVGLMNIVHPPRYDVETVTVRPTAPLPAYRPNLVVIGGSFMWKPLDMFGASRQFSEIAFYSYYTVAKHLIVDGRRVPIAAPAPKLDFDTDVFAADALVLEINEEYIRDGRGIKNFLRDALAVLPDPHAPKAAFSYGQYHATAHSSINTP